jgi:hypothetical protein
MLGVMRSELTTAMILTGCKTAALANADMLDVAAPQNLSP